MAYCAPNKGKGKSHCLDENIVEELVDEYNKKFREKIDKNLTTDQKLKILLNKIKIETGGCDKDYCLLKSNIFNRYRNTLKKYYRPELPQNWKKDKNEWLNTLDILASLNQYSESYPEFIFLSVSPIDFDTLIGSTILNLRCVDESLCKFNVSNVAKAGKSKIGAVFNLDNHLQSGSHWVAFFSDFILGECYYFDSVANTPPNEVVTLCKRIAEQSNLLVINNSIKLKTSNRFTFKSNKFSVEYLLEYLLRDNNFILYLYGTISINSYNLENFKLNSLKNSETIFKTLKDFVYSKKAKRYVKTDNLDYLLDNYGEDVYTFADNWLISQVSKACINFLNSMTTIKCGTNTYQILEIKYDKDIFEVITNNPINNCIDVSFKCYKNFIQHQFKNTECGMYSINFIDAMLTSGKTFFEIISDVKDDDTINKLRFNKFYTPL
jgi:hypothetical protein